MRLLSILLLTVLLFGCAAQNTPPTSLTITTANLPAARIKEVYAEQLTAVGGVAPYTWSVVSGSLPAGVTISPAGVLSGIPTVPGAFNFTVQVIDSANSQAKIQIGGKRNETS